MAQWDISTPPMYFVTRCEDSSLEVIPDADQTHLISENHFVPLYICFHIINTMIEIVFFAAGDHRIKSGLLSTNPDIHTETRIHPHPISGKDSLYWENTFFINLNWCWAQTSNTSFTPKYERSGTCELPDDHWRHNNGHESTKFHAKAGKLLTSVVFY